MATAAEWTILDNLKHHWPIKTNLLPNVAEAAYEECKRKGWVAVGLLTDAGSIELLRPIERAEAETT